LTPDYNRGEWFESHLMDLCWACDELEMLNQICGEKYSCSMNF
jgi:hypothetical protein